MSTPPNSAHGASPEIEATRPVEMPLIQTFQWSVRRELWENRSIYIAPLAAAGVAMLGYLVELLAAPHSHHMQGSGDAEERFVMLVMPYGHTGWLLLITAFLVGVFYSLDALYGERRDRSILFWKSLPVSDRTTVLSKASIPLVVLPVIVVVVTIVTQLTMALISSGVLLLGGSNPMTLWSQLPLFEMQTVLVYGVIALALGQAPLFAWLLLISSWARRTAFLWAVLPPLGICAIEKIIFKTQHFAHLLGYLLTGGTRNAFSFRTPSGAPVDAHFIPLAQITPGRFLGNPGLWIGLVFAAIFLAAAVRLRRYREPI
jgi:ABC-2 type transport system permease protein